MMRVEWSDKAPRYPHHPCAANHEPGMAMNQTGERSFMFIRRKDAQAIV